jgi:hypothetical protein
MDGESREFHQIDFEEDIPMIKQTTGLLTAVTMLLLGPVHTGPLVHADARTQPVQDLVKHLELGTPVSQGSLTIIPVYLDKVRDRVAYVTMEDALRKGWITITEVEGGRVPQVKISNLSRHLIFLMGGEILSGCRQDRLLAGDILLAPGTRDLLAPVYCVEHGRWSQTSDRFYSKQNLGTPALRAVAQERPASAQSEIWSRIADQNMKMGVSSRTNAFQEAFEKEENRELIQKVEKKLADLPRLHDDTVGVVIGLNGRVTSVDIFVNPGLFAKQWPKILRSSALSSIGHKKGRPLDRSQASRFLQSFLKRRYRSKSGLDLGHEYSSSESDANIQALVYRKSVIHCSAFPQEDDRIKVIR